MEKGYLIVSVYADTIANPISDASVTVRGENYEQVFTTGVNGKTITIELDAPLKIYSLTPQSEVRPYSIYQLEVSKPGYETTIINGVQVFPEETSLQDVFLPVNTTSNANILSAISVAANEVKVIDLPPHSLWETAEETNPTDLSQANDLRVLPDVIIPEYIIVHNGNPSDSGAAKYYVPFTDYIKNVASSEIYSTWPAEAIKANVYAILSYTMNRIITEWYPSQGYKFTITSLPRYDHTYVNNRTIFKSISDVVDQIFEYHIQLDGKDYPFLAQYNDGIKTNNTGWLSQWGSKSMADQGFDALQILRNYYTNSLTLERAEQIAGLPISFPGYNLILGTCGDAVQKLQIKLNTINGNYPGIPRIIPADGKYNEKTKNSVRVFQEVFNLPVTGVVDFTTWYRISYIYIAVSRMLQGV